MSEKNQKTQIAYRVEKFIPTACPNPKCFNPFTENSEQGFLLGTYWLHETRERAEAILKSISFPGLKTDLIVCGKCHNVVMRVMIEEREYLTCQEAEKAVQAEGFVNLTEAEVVGIVLPQAVVYLTERETDGIILFL